MVSRLLEILEEISGRSVREKPLLEYFHMKRPELNSLVRKGLVGKTKFPKWVEYHLTQEGRATLRIERRKQAAEWEEAERQRKD